VIEASTRDVGAAKGFYEKLRRGLAYMDQWIVYEKRNYQKVEMK
jgi:hypothetical protein